MTAAQKEAVLADEPVICVLAGAGAGKTGVLTARVARRDADGTARADRTLVCTFSRRAADELWVRLVRLGVRGATVGTIHRVALRILVDWRQRRHAPAPSILGRRGALIERVLSTRQPLPVTSAQLESEIGWAKARMVGPEEYEAAAARAGRSLRIPAGLTAELFALYEQERRRRSLLDLDDLLDESALVMEHEAFAEATRWRLRHVLVDEMQDVNPAQFRLLQAIVGPEPDLVAVGDPSQSVYGWNGADPGLLEALPSLFDRVRVVHLDDNHRSTPAIVRLAAAALGRRPDTVRCSRPEGPVPALTTHESDEEEASWVAREAWRAHRPGRRWSHMAVLARTNAQLEAFVRVFSTRQIPVRLAGTELGPASDLGPVDRDATIHIETEGRRGPVADDPDAVVLSTFHRSKGLQWPCVFVVGLCEGLVPIRSARSSAALAEERRLLYVAMTRAEDQLWCSWSSKAAPGASDRSASRWLAEVEQARAQIEEERSPAPPQAAASHLARIRALVARDGPA